MISKRVIALQNAYPLGLEHEKYWRIKKGRIVKSDGDNNYDICITSKWGRIHYNPADFREITNVEKLTGRML